MNQNPLDTLSTEIVSYENIDNSNSQSTFPWESEQNQATETLTETNAEIPNEIADNVTVENQIILRNSGFGGIILPQNTDKNSTYNIASIDLDPFCYSNSSIYFNFCCNIATLNAQVQLKFQLYKQDRNQIIPLPVGSAFNFIRMNPTTQTDVFSLTACDQNLRVSNRYNYSVCIEVMGFNTVGTVTITNPILTALII